MTERLSSGQALLDGVLGGGLPAQSINLIVGLPGTGKTILAQQYVFWNATPERPAVYFSSVSEPFDKILRYGQTLAFFDAAAVGRSVFYEDLGEDLRGGGLDAVLEHVVGAVRERRPSVVVVDSFKALRAFSDGDGPFRRFLHELAGALTAFPATSFWVGEYDGDELSSTPEFAVADSILVLASSQASERSLRTLEVRKLRGSAFLSGKHAYRISPDGIQVFPRLADVSDESSYQLGPGKISTGVPGIDELLSDGLWPGASTLVFGPTGCGKTLLGLHFLFSGIRSGEPGVLATFQENPTQLHRIAAAFGWSLSERGLRLLYRSPVDLYLDEWVYELLAAAEETGARRVVIDSLGDLWAAAPDEVRFRECAYSLMQRLSRAGTSVLMTLEAPELFRVTKLSELGVSHLSDNVILLQYVERESEVRRALTVLKTRASRNVPEVREFRIEREGIVLGERLVAGENTG